MFENTAVVEKTFSALADSTRLAIIERLALGESSLSELAEPFDMSQTAVSKHINILSEAGLVKISKRGRTRYCEVIPSPLAEAEKWLDSYQQFWAKQLNSLAKFLDEESEEQDKLEEK